MISQNFYKRGVASFPQEMPRRVTQKNLLRETESEWRYFVSQGFRLPPIRSPHPSLGSKAGVVLPSNNLGKLSGTMATTSFSEQTKTPELPLSYLGTATRQAVYRESNTFLQFAFASWLISKEKKPFHETMVLGNNLAAKLCVTSRERGLRSSVFAFSSPAPF